MPFSIAPVMVAASTSTLAFGANRSSMPPLCVSNRASPPRSTSPANVIVPVTDSNRPRCTPPFISVMFPLMDVSVTSSNRPFTAMSPVAVPHSAAARPAQAEGPAEPTSMDLAVIKSPIVGTLYRAPEPGAPNFVEVGDRVKKGQVLCIIEAMKLMNEIESEADGAITAVHVENGRPVQFGDRLFTLKVSV